MIKVALGIAAFLAVFAVLVLAAGSIPPQPQTDARNGTQLRAVDRGHVIERGLEARRATSSRTSGATSVP
jgi:hypothetical protein